MDVDAVSSGRAVTDRPRRTSTTSAIGGRGGDPSSRRWGSPTDDADLVEVVVGDGQRPLSDVTEIRVSTTFAALMKARSHEVFDPSRVDPLAAPADPAFTLFATLLVEHESGGTPLLVAPEVR